ncbi:MAG: glycosyltransferase family 2 protein [bacterium]|nr:glycosyltransferase family 2 protein [bacterium]
MRLSIITINYNGSERTIKLLKSLAEQTDQDFQTIVVDNASEEADFNNLRQAIGGAILIRNEQNLGFSGGNNVGIGKVMDLPAGGGADWVLLLNNDTLVEGGFMASLKAKLSQLSGIVGVPLNEGDYTAYCGKVEWLRPTLRHINNPLYSENLTRNSKYYAIGGAVAIHKDVFESVGFMDEKYFLYFEDADLSIKAQVAGFELTFLEEPKAHHQVSSTTKKLGSPLLLRYHYRNALYFNFKNGPWYIKLLVWPWSFWTIKKQLLKIMLMYRQEESLAILKGVFDFYINKMGKIE